MFPEFAVRFWARDQGLPQDDVRALAQTPDGYLWVGTLAGLVRFDGHRFRSFGLDQDPDAPGNRVLSLATATDGTLWVGTDYNGLARFDGTRFHNDPESVALGPIRDVVEDGEGCIWVMGRNQIGRRRREAATVVPLRNAPRKALRDLAVGEDGRLLVASAHGAHRWSDGGFEPLQVAPGLGAIRRFFPGPGKRLWCLAAEGVGVVEGPRVRAVRSCSIAQGSCATFVDDVLLLAHWTGNRSFVLSGAAGSEQLLDAASPWVLPLNASRISQFFRDDEGSLWAAHGGEGLAQITRPSFAWVDTGGAQTTRVVAGRGTVWIGAQGQLAQRIRSEGRFARVEIAGQAQPYGDVEPMAADAGGGIWVRAMGRAAVGRYTDRGTRWHALRSRAWGVAVAADGAAWVGQRDGSMRCVIGDVVHKVDVPDCDGDVWVHYVDPRGWTWFSTHGAVGRCRFEHREPRFEIHEFEGAARRAPCRSIVSTPDGDVWVATYGAGLHRWRDGVWTRYGVDEGLVDPYLGGLLLADQRLWVNSNAGVQVFELAAFDAMDRGERAHVVVHLLETGECDEGFAARDADGRMWFPTVDGLRVVDPSRFDPRAEMPRPQIESVARDRAGTQLGRRDASGRRVFAAGTTRLEIAYTAILLSAPERVRFRYRLEGFEDEWIDAGARRTAYFTGLSPGHYRFVVEAAGVDGRWNPAAAAVEVEVLPHFYEAPWFRWLVLGLAALSGWGIYRSRVGALARRNQLLAAELAARRRAEAAEKDRHALSERLRDIERLEIIGRLSAGVAHDFNNVLTVILGRAELLPDSKGEAELREHAESILECGERAANLTRQLLAFGRQQVLRPRSLDPASVVERLEPMLRQLLPEAIRLDVERPAAAARGWVRVDEGQLEQVVMNLVLNARDAMPDGGVIRIELEAQGEPAQWMVLRVRDTGRGMEPEVRDRVFEPFFTTKGAASGRGRGAGMGLASTQGIVAQSGGTIHVESTPGQGSTFEVRLPTAPRDPVVELPRPAPAGPSVPGMGFALLCEDYAPITRVVERHLESREVVVQIAERPGDALRIARSVERLDLLIVDLDLPEMSGHELALEICALHRGVRVVFMSGLAPAVDLECERRGWTFLQKPFSSRELFDKIDKVYAAGPGGHVVG